MDRSGPTHPVLLASILIALALPIVLVFWAHAETGRNGFPLDDAWIHLTYARTLAEHGAFAYFPGDPATQGSTSPLYTSVLALGLLVASDEKVLSYALGILFQTGFLIFLALWARRRLGSPWWAAAAVLVTGLDGRVAVLSISGMETSLFLCCIAAAFAARVHGKWALAGIAAGLAVWTRPDALFLALLLGADGLLQAFGARVSGGVRRILRYALAIVVVLGAYAFFNLIAGGSILPNTFGAKTAYYAPNSSLAFLRDGFAALFLSGPWPVIAPFALLAAVRAIQRLRRFEAGVLVEAVWAIGLPLAYAWILPFNARFERYLVPALPAFGVLGVMGLAWVTHRWIAARGDGARSRTAVSAAAKTDIATREAGATNSGRVRATGAGGMVGVVGAAGVAGVVVIAAALALAIPQVARSARSYAFLREYHWERHERTGLWLAEHTPPDAVIATHDIGAIAFYSRRRVVDVVGLVLPEAVEHLHQPGYTDWLEELFRREGVTHLAVLRDWLEVVNIDPLFVADPEPEILEVFAWAPGRTHLVPAEASLLNRRAASEIQARRSGEALAYLQGSLQRDADNARTWMLYGAVLEMSGRAPEAEAAYRRTIELHPGNADAQVRLASALLRQGRADSARTIVEGVLARDPSHGAARRLRARLGAPATPAAP